MVQFHIKPNYEQMKVTFLAILALLIPLVTFSQMNQSLDYVNGIDYSYRNLSTLSKDEIVVGIMESRDQKETGKLNWRIGFNYNQRLTRKLLLRTGLRFASVGYKGEKNTDLRWPNQHDGNGGLVVDPTLPRELQLIYDYWFTEIPIVARYEISKEKLSPFVEIGLSPSIYMTTRTISRTDIGNNSDFNNGHAHKFNRVHFVGFISLGLNYTISDKLQFFGQPAFRYHFTRLVDAPINEHLVNYGVEFGIRCKI